MKTISKTFWLISKDFERIEQGYPADICLYLDNAAGSDYKITISYEIPEKVIQLSESDFDRMKEEYLKDHFSFMDSNSFIDSLKEKLFKDN